MRKKCKKVGIVTIYDLTNYGNRLQNYALQEILKNVFHCEVCSLVSIKQKPFHDGNIIAWLKEEAVINSSLNQSFAEKHFGANVTRTYNFENWNKLIREKNYYETIQLSKVLNSEYDFFIAGSDQIWNPNISEKQFYNYHIHFHPIK